VCTMASSMFNQFTAWVLGRQHDIFDNKNRPRSKVQATSYDNRRRGYVPLATITENMLTDDFKTCNRSATYHIVMVGDYKSGVSTVRSEFIRMSCTSVPDLGVNLVTVAILELNTSARTFERYVQTLQLYFHATRT
uniref:Uncharacterized protein n=1 Tax=Parascaris univalens TaxID=6257 RepID=A0A915A0A6_PARUN